MRSDLAQSGTSARSATPHARLLAVSVVGLSACVLGLILLSLGGCEMFQGGGTLSDRAEAPASSPAGAAAATPHVAPATRRFSVSGVRAEPEMRVRIASGVNNALVSTAPRGWKPVVQKVNPVAGAPPQLVNPPLGPVLVNAVGARAATGGTSSAAPSGTRGGSRLAGPVRVTAPVPGSDEWTLTDSAGATHRIMAEALEFSADTPPAESAAAASDAEPARFVTLGDLAYPGRLRLTPRSDSPAPAFDIIEHVSLETYLRGVVVKEMYPNWPLEAFRVQAICARTYALHERVRAGVVGRVYDVEASQRDQAYSGLTSNARAIQAVVSTRGLVLAHDDAVIRAYYSSSCGGRSGGARDTWPIGPGFEYNLALPIQAYPRESLCDRSSPQFAWTVTRDRDELVRRLRAYGETNGMLIRKLDNIASLQVLRAASTGRPVEYKIVEPGGRWFQLKAEDLRLACNTGVQGLPPITNKDRVLSGDVSFKVIPPAKSPAASTPRPTAGAVEISGRGFGHGVGMCQYCTKTMAERGDDWRSMLMRFYPGADLVRAYP